MFKRKFEQLVDLGIITVPSKFDQAICLKNFRKKHLQGFSVFDPTITDFRYRKVTTKLAPGQNFRVQAWKQIVSKTTSEERLEFLASINAALVGAQGLTLVFEQKRERLLRNKDYWKYYYTSFDLKEALWYNGIVIGVPGLGLHMDSSSCWTWSLGSFEHPWGNTSALLSFEEVII